MVPMAPLGHLNIVVGKDVSAMRIAFLVVAVLFTSFLPASAGGLGVELVGQRYMPQRAGVSVRVDVFGADGQNSASPLSGTTVLPVDRWGLFTSWFDRISVRMPVSGIPLEKVLQKDSRMEAPPGGWSRDQRLQEGEQVKLADLQPGSYVILAEVVHSTGTRATDIAVVFHFVREVSETDSGGASVIIADATERLASVAKLVFDKTVDQCDELERLWLVAEYFDSRLKGSVQLVRNDFPDANTISLAIRNRNDGAPMMLQSSPSPLQMRIEELEKTILELQEFLTTANAATDKAIATQKTTAADLKTSQEAERQAREALANTEADAEAKTKEVEVLTSKVEKLESALTTANAATDKAIATQKTTAADLKTSQEAERQVRQDLANAKANAEAKTIQVKLLEGLVSELARVSESDPFANARKAMSEGKAGAVIVLPSTGSYRFWLDAGCGWQQCQLLSGTVVPFLYEPATARAKGWQRFVILPDGEAPRGNLGWEVPTNGVMIVTPQEVCR